MSQLLKQLNKYFQFDSFRPGQEEIIQSIIAGHDVLGILPTGAGKSLCYLLPAKIVSGMTIVVSPLLSLIEDQVHQLRAKGEKNAVQLNGFMTNNEKNYILSRLHKGSILYISPEMLSNKYVLSYLKRLPIGLFVIDEAHCISQWGHEFRTDYLRLKDIRIELNTPPCLALTATATPQVEEDIINRLQMTQPVIHRHSVDRQNISYFVKRTESMAEKEEFFFHYLEKLVGSAIIYVATRKETENICEKMKEKGYEKVAFYHGGMEKGERLLVQYQFLQGELDYVCATNAFGMGINKADVRSVIHLHLPSSMEQYVQEVGRAGRDGEKSIALLLYESQDREIPLSFLENEFPSEKELTVWFQTMQGMETDQDKRLHTSVIQKMFSVDETRWRMVLYYLERKAIVINNEILVDRLTKDLLAQLNKHFLNRKKVKLGRFREFERMLSSQACIRTSILQYFGEELMKKQDPCCTNCGASLEKMTGEWERKASLGKSKSASWQEDLAAILLPHLGGRSFGK